MRTAVHVLTLLCSLVASACSGGEAKLPDRERGAERNIADYQKRGDPARTGFGFEGSNLPFRKPSSCTAFRDEDQTQVGKVCLFGARHQLSIPLIEDRRGQRFAAVDVGVVWQRSSRTRPPEAFGVLADGSTTARGGYAFFSDNLGDGFVGQTVINLVGPRDRQWILHEQPGWLVLPVKKSARVVGIRFRAGGKTLGTRWLREPQRAKSPEALLHIAAAKAPIRPPDAMYLAVGKPVSRINAICGVRQGYPLSSVQGLVPEHGYNHWVTRWGTLSHAPSRHAPVGAGYLTTDKDTGTLFLVFPDSTSAERAAPKNSLRYANVVAVPSLRLRSWPKAVGSAVKVLQELSEQEPPERPEACG